ncbi:hypothetical protein KIN20_026985 [Parelaphostrongylus tenuis]|uniref:Protein kinase domain-containing protein n=1 Tax=Parelaphostrongylus tenuis TaxID=148309 RepID=A0AAD5QYQ9_PARTN|nr:hypothetical protein KIN20_026985 [Parelaphostrongylus tenuis]
MPQANSSATPQAEPSETPQAKSSATPQAKCLATESKVVQTAKLKQHSKEKLGKREKMKEGDTLKSDNFKWKVVKLLGSGGFGDVYKVVKVDSEDTKKYALKTETCEGDKRLLRLKVEVYVLKLCQKVDKPERKKHFIELVDRGKNEKFKFLVMGLVGQSLEDIRRSTLRRNYSKSTGMQIAHQTLQAVYDLHELGYLHRDIKPQNFAVGLELQRNVIYMLDFGIARRFTIGSTKELKAPRLYVKFIGTIRFASRACHNCVEQGRKDDLESWLYMAFDVLDNNNGLPWKRVTNRRQVLNYKQKFFAYKWPKCYEIVPNEYKRLVQYLNCLNFTDEPDYIYMIHSIRAIAKENGIDMDEKLDWEMSPDQRQRETETEPSEDNKKTGTDDSGTNERTSKTKQATTRRKERTGAHTDSKFINSRMKTRKDKSKDRAIENQ